MLTPLRGLFEGMAGAQDEMILERTADNLHGERQARRAETAADGERRRTGDVERTHE